MVCMVMALAFTWNSGNYHSPCDKDFHEVGCLSLSTRETGSGFIWVCNSQKTKNLFWLIFRELAGQCWAACVPQKHEFKACPVRCLFVRNVRCCGKEWSFAENKIRNSLFFTNTKTTKFINFLYCFFPKKRGNKMSSLKEAYLTPTGVSDWDARE